MAFTPVGTKVSFPQLEEQVLARWQEREIVAKSLASGDPNRPFVFYEGPPTSNGRPGLHHVISRVFKDVIPRFRAMQGYKIIGRREGWDTHGLPVEIEVEKKLGFKGKPDIEKYGIAAFNAACRQSVWEYIQEWKTFTRRIAYWVDEDGYITYENRYIESLWWIMRQLWDKGQLFRDYKVTMHCPRCGTSLSDAEVNLGYQDDVDDPSVWVSFRHAPSGHPLDAQLADAAFLAWTTTPWTLPANAALCVKPGAAYVLAEADGARYVLAEALMTAVLGEDATVAARFNGDDLVGLRYTPLYQGVGGAGLEVDLSTGYRVISDDYVSLDDGTGIVHIAPAYGDLDVGRKYGLPTLFSVDLSGNVIAELGNFPFTGMFFKKADPEISRDLKARGLLFKSGRIKHTYPFCWRCSTPLLFFAKQSWYIRTTAKKAQLIENNQQINWVPEHVRDGRFGNWLENNIDWAVSRERYWGTPLPIWVGEDGHTEVIGSVAELEERTGRTLRDLDLHRPYVDEISWADPQHGTMRRIPDVADCWFDSGSMPIAQWHYPFENREIYAQASQADYICEAVDQTRGWFYTLHAISTMLFDRPAFKNVICLGHILDEQGFKMSKTKGNIIQPMTVIDEQGVDALRWYLFTASAPGSPRRFSSSLVNESLRKFMLTLWNTYSFFVTYANLDGWMPSSDTETAGHGATETPAHPFTPSPLHETPALPVSLAPIDRWALASLNALVRDVTADMEGYNPTDAARKIEWFVDELSNWYVRRNRRRFWKSESDSDKRAAYATLHTCLLTLTKLAAPFAPFVTDAMYLNLTGGAAAESVHLDRWPEVDAALLDEQLVGDTRTLLKVVSLGRAARKSAGIRVRQPLQEIWVRVLTPAAADGIRRFEAEIRDELNIKQVRYLDSTTDFIEYRFKPNLRLVGKKYGKQVPALTAALKALEGDAARAAAGAVERGETLMLDIDGGALALQADEILVESSSPAGFSVAEDGGLLCALDTTITPELTAEGLAREVVRNIQDARKEAGFAISDRVRVYLGGSDAEVEAMVATWGEYIRQETLADDLLLADVPHGTHTATLDLEDGRAVSIGVIRN